jgi:hypothetical protein
MHTIMLMPKCAGRSLLRVFMLAVAPFLALLSASGADFDFPTQPVAPTSDEVCRDFNRRMTATIGDLFKTRPTVQSIGAVTGWKTHPAPSCPNGETYGPEEWAPYDNAVCAAQALRTRGVKQCMDEVRASNARVTAGAELSIFREAAVAYARNGTSSIADFLPPGNTSPVASFYRGVQNFSNATHVATAMLDVSRRDTPDARRASAATELSIAGLEPGFRGNTAASLIANVASDVIVRLYEKSMTELQQELAGFDAGAISGPGAPSITYQKTYAYYMVRRADIMRAQELFAQRFSSSRLTYTGESISRSAHAQAVAAETSNYEPAYRPSRPDRNTDAAELGRAFGEIIGGAILEAERIRQQQGAQGENAPAPGSSCSDERNNCKPGCPCR